MASSALLVLIAAVICITFLPFSWCTDEEDSQVHIVYMGKQAHDQQMSGESYHMSILEPMLGTGKVKESLVYSYRSFNAFAVKLTAKEKQQLQSKKGVASVFPSRILKPHTTRSWDFLGFPETVDSIQVQESDVIIGMIDSGVWPESESFNDDGIAEPPSRWRGKCTENFKCNNKIIGARYYNSQNKYNKNEEGSARDMDGHGSHTAATAAGRPVKNASLNGIAKGTARGAVPSARIAVYKVCWAFGCAEQDVLAAFDDAINDGVDIISASLGGDKASEYLNDSVAIGAFHAMKHGILTSVSAGNSGPDHASVVNVAPWLLSTAATTTDRRVVTKLVVGDNDQTLLGVSVNTFPTQEKSYQLINAEKVVTEEDLLSKNESSLQQQSIQTESVFDRKAAKGKIIEYSDDTYDSSLLGTIMTSGAKGIVIVDDARSQYAKTYPLPAVVLNTSTGKLLQSIHKSRERYMTVKLIDGFMSTHSGSFKARIHESESILDDHKKTTVGYFSSRGPNPITPDILKPDVSAPGVEILSAWSPKSPIADYSGDKRSMKYNILTGTSMACPHATGAAAYVKSFHPTWSPSAILSALVTTAIPINSSSYSALDTGAGQINPVGAAHPGLLYEATTEDYAKLLCNQGYNKHQLQLITGDSQYNCSIHAGHQTSARDFNYPSMSYHLISPTQHFKVYFPRTVTNVGSEKSVYMATIQSTDHLNITVKPTVLSFEKLGAKLKFVVTVSSVAPITSSESAALVWSDGKHSVRSPIVVSL